MLGFFLLAPMFVLVLERVAGPAVAGALRLRYALVRQQMSNGIWRAAGTCAALMVGLSLLVAMEIHGKSLLSAWQIPDKFPDIFIVSLASGLDEAQVNKLEHLKGIKPANCCRWPSRRRSSARGCFHSPWPGSCPMPRCSSASIRPRA